MIRPLGKIGVYGPKTRLLQRRITYEVFGLSWKIASVYRYLGDRTKANPTINDIHTTVFAEVPDRAYDSIPVDVPIGMDPLPEQKTDFSRFGIVDIMGDENTFRMHIDDFDALGRELIEGDVFSMDFFKKDGKLAFWEVTDVDKASEYEKFIAIITAVPLQDKRTTRDIPIEQSNSDIMDELAAQEESEFSESVPSEETTFDETVPTETEVDYRDSTQSSFLDDPNKEF